LHKAPTNPAAIKPNATPMNPSTAIPSLLPKVTPGLTPSSPSGNTASSPPTNLKTKRSASSNIELVTNRLDENSTNELDKFIMDAASKTEKKEHKENTTKIVDAPNTNTKPKAKYNFGETMKKFLQRGKADNKEENENHEVSRQETLVANSSVMSKKSEDSKTTALNKNSLREKIGPKAKSRETIFEEVTKGLYIDEMFQMNKHFLKEKINNVLIERKEIRQLAKHSFRKLDNMLIFIQELGVSNLNDFPGK